MTNRRNFSKEHKSLGSIIKTLLNEDWFKNLLTKLLLLGAKSRNYTAMTRVFEKNTSGEPVSYFERLMIRAYSKRESGKLRIKYLGKTYEFDAQSIFVKPGAKRNYDAALDLLLDDGEELIADGIKLLQNAAAVQPEYKEAYVLLGRAYLRLEDYQSALAYLSKAKESSAWLHSDRPPNEKDKELEFLIVKASSAIKQ